MPAPRPLLLPGLAADGRLLEPQRSVFPRLACPDWPPHRGGESLAAFAGRCAELWVGGGGPVDAGRPVWLGGVSFGGMVALEMGRHLLAAGTPPAGVVLIASCRSREAVTPAFRRRAALGGLLPAGPLRFFLGGPGARHFARREGLSGRWPGTLAAMGRETDIPFLKWAAGACARWPLTRAEAMRPGFPVLQIHGQRDKVIPCRPQDCDRVFPTAGHLLNVTHAGAVNDLLRSWMTGR